MAMRAAARVLVVGTVLAGCAPAAGGPTVGPPAGPVREPLAPGEVRWTVATYPEFDLWYHGLAYTGFGATGDVPIYRPEYVREIVAAKRALGAHPTVLDERAEEFGRLFAADERFAALQFLPLYFANGEEFFGALRAWVQAGGDPGRAGSQRAAQMVGFLSRQLPTQAERQTVARWLDVLAEEDLAFFDRYRAGRQAELASLAARVQGVWEGIAPSVQPVLDYLILNEGEMVLSLPLGSEGRTIDLGRQDNRVAVGVPDPDRPADAVWAFLHELMYPYVRTVIEDQVSPAERRSIGEEVLARRAAVRAGAALLARAAPESVADYQAAYLRWAGTTPPASPMQRGPAFEREYPVPAGLAEALAEGLESILRGI